MSMKQNSKYDANLLSAKIKQRAKEIGFMDCGIAKAERLDDEAIFLQNWLNQQQHGEMHYMSNHFEKRVDPRLLVEGAKSVISLSYNYYTNVKPIDVSAPKIASYAYGKDYHKVVKKKLDLLFKFIETEIGEKVHGRCFVDSAPIMERAWAQRSGIGWIGKNTMLMTKRKGSFFFLAEIILDLELAYDSPVKDYCGSCTKCIDACPTQALKPYEIDGSKCISYFTIEYKADEVPNEYKGKFQNWMFGCDICQQVCPINSQSEEHSEQDFIPNEELLSMSKQDWSILSEEKFNELFLHSAVERTKYKGLRRNIDFLEE